MPEKIENHHKGEVPPQPAKNELEPELDKVSLDEISGGKSNLTYTSISNVMKIRHETAKNAVNNIR